MVLTNISFWYTIVLKLDERGINMLQIKYCLSMTENFYNKVKYNAEKSGLTIASYIRYAVMKFMESEEK